MKKTLAKKIERILANSGHRTFKPKELARMLSVSKVDYSHFRRDLKQMAETGIIARHKRNQYGTIKRAQILTGELHVKSQGYGFLITPEGEEDVFISQKNMGTALHKDTVKVQLFAESSRRRREGRVIEVVERAFSKIVGTFYSRKHYNFVTPDSGKIHRDIFIHPDVTKKAKSGQKVVVSLTNWDNPRTGPEGEIVEILGFPDEPGVDVMSVAKSYDLPADFPAEVEKEAEIIPSVIANDEMKKRLDLRKEVCFTIDPDDAKDFDDAISIEILRNGNARIGVHIADVSYYVGERGALDREALKRGTSIYLVDRVIPMLPEKLSNQICSLRPDEDRLTMSCVMEVDSQGLVKSYDITPSVIRSKKRFSYEEVQEIIDGGGKKKPHGKLIMQMVRVSKVLTQRREKLGSLDFNLPEVKVRLNEQGEPIEIKRKERLDSHRLVEEFMLLANRTVTEHVALKMAETVQTPPFIYRIHEAPNEDKMNDFKRFVHALGLPLDPNRKVTPKLLSDYMRRIKGTPEETLIEDVMLRSLMKARYATDNAGHFGLAFKHYTHFTSPIRRYPDLVVHRLLKEYQNGFDQSTRAARLRRLDRIAKWSSEREVVATEAERESIKLKKIEYMERHLGDEFEGVVSGVVPFGIFVEIIDLLVEGLVHISDLDDDYYVHDEAHYQLTGTASGHTYRLGDNVRVKVVRVDKNERVLDFILA